MFQSLMFLKFLLDNSCSNPIDNGVVYIEIFNQITVTYGHYHFNLTGRVYLKHFACSAKFGSTIFLFLSWSDLIG